MEPRFAHGRPGGRAAGIQPGGGAVIQQGGGAGASAVVR